MAAGIPAKLRISQITPFIQRAAQLDRHKPIISYWLRYYATQKIIGKNLHLVDAECTTYTTNLMERLEETKVENPAEDALTDEVAAYAYCEQFALQTFAKGDNEVRMDKVTKNTADTFQAAATFLEMLSIWQKPNEPENPEIIAKLKFAKYHAVRILRAIKAGEDPNLSNPKLEVPPEASATPLDVNDVEVQRINGSAPPQPTQNPYQSYAESAPNTSTRPSPTVSPPRGPSPGLPSAPTGYSHTSPPPVFFSHQDVSPISQPANSRQGSVVSVGGGYFPRVDVPTFTADNAAPSLPTAPSMEDEPMTSPYDNPALPQAPQAPPPALANDPQSFYQSQTSPPPIHPPASQQFQHQPQHVFQPQPSFTSPPPHPPPPPQSSAFPSSPIPPQQQQNPYSPQPPQSLQPQAHLQHYASPIPAAPQALRQGPFNTDEESVMQAQKRAKWAISALNFEDVNTAVQELRAALNALGAL